MMSLSYVYGVDGLQWENKKETEEKLVDFFFTLTKYGREDVWKSVIVLVCGYKTQSWLFVQYWKDRFILVIESSLKSFVLLFIST